MARTWKPSYSGLSIWLLLAAVWPLLLPALAGVALVVVIDLGLYGLSSHDVIPRFPPEVWGTYAAWASAIVPALILYATVAMWIGDKRITEAREVWAEVNQVLIEERVGGGTYLVNGSSETINVLSADGGDDSEAVVFVRPGKDSKVQLRNESQPVRVTVRGVSYEVSLHKAPKKL